MPEITNDKYIIPGISDLINLVKNKSPKMVWLFRHAYLDTLWIYWRYAVASVRVFQETIKQPELKQSGNNLSDDEKDDLRFKNRASAVSAYQYMRICLTACKILTDNALRSSASDETAKNIQAFKNEYKSYAKKIVDIRNLVGSHPEKTHKLISESGAYGIGLNMKIGFCTINLDELKLNKDSIQLDPGKDLLTLQKYIIGLMPLLKKCWSI